jgi:hypothetical protein
MSKKQSSERSEDLSFMLYLVPLAISTVYALVLWVQTGLGAILPQTAYFGVTKSPIVFLAGFTAVLLAATLDVTKEEGEGRRKAELFAVSKRVQRLAIVCFVLALITAWYATGFTRDAGAIAFTFLSGRYALVFPALLVAFSFLILPTLKIQTQQARTVIAVLCLLSVPAVIREVGKRSTVAGLIVSLILILAAVLLILLGRRDETSRSAPATPSSSTP